MLFAIKLERMVCPIHVYNIIYGTPTPRTRSPCQSYRYNNLYDHRVFRCLRPKTYTGRHFSRTLRVTERRSGSVSAPAFRQTVVGARDCRWPNLPCLRMPWWFRFRSWPLPARRTCSPSVRVLRKWCTGHNIITTIYNLFYIIFYVPPPPPKIIIWFVMSIMTYSGSDFGH